MNRRQRQARALRKGNLRQARETREAAEWVLATEDDSVQDASGTPASNSSQPTPKEQSDGQ